MALKAGYKGIKKYIADKLNALGDLGELATDAEVKETISDALDAVVGWNQDDTHDSVETLLSEKADITDIGTEEGEKASRLYHVGEHFYKNGKFCTVIGSSDVAAESTWTLNTNYVEGDVASELLSKFGTFSPETGFSIFASINSVKQNNGICVLNIALSFNVLTAESWVKVGVITNISLPLQEMRYVNITLHGKVVITRIKTDGEIDLFTYTAISENDTVTINMVYTTN